MSQTVVDDEEKLARFILSSSWFRPSNKTVKPDAFMPPPNLKLSVFRHAGLLDSELWDIGHAIASQRQPPATLHGRADIICREVHGQGLKIEPTPTPRNHANITGWSVDKPTQKIVALQLAAVVKFVPPEH